MTNYIQGKLERLSFNPDQFRTELNQSMKILIASEIDELADWFVKFTKDKPHLRNYKNYTAYDKNLLM